MLDIHSIRPDDSHVSTDSTPDTLRYQNRTSGTASMTRLQAWLAFVRIASQSSIGTLSFVPGIG